MSTQMQGARFEAEVARLYEALGFVVKRDLLLSGQQVDMLAEKHVPGIGLTRLLIECKYLESGSVSNQTVQDFLAMFSAIARSHSLTAGVVVTNGKYSRNAKALDTASNVFLLTTGDLEREAMNASDAAYMYVSEYESSEISRTYVPMAAESDLPHSILPPPPPTDDPDAGKQKLNGIESPLVAWLRAGEALFLTVLADFGAGKTSLLQRLKYELSRIALSQGGADAKVPMLFALRDLPKYTHLDDYISSVIARELKRPVSMQLFWRFLESGLIVPLLDGFDEAATYTDATDRRRLFLQLSPLINRCGGSVIMTCRPTFFVTATEYHDLLQELAAPQRSVLLTTTISDDEQRKQVQSGLHSIKKRLHQQFVRDTSVQEFTKPTATLTLQVFDRRQIAAYLKGFDADFRKEVARTWRQIYRFLRRVYDLSDLMKRPFLLKMITETVLTRELAIDDRSLRLGASGLYETYTSIQFEREAEQKNRSLFTIQERQLFAHLIAIQMQAHGYGGVSFESIVNVVAKSSSFLASIAEKLSSAGELAAASDATVCTFLERRDDGRFHFVHKSFMEFFLARQIKTSLEAASADPLLESPMSDEVLYFLGSFVGLDEKLQRRLVDIYERATSELTSSRTIRRNILGALAFTATETSRLFLREGVFEQLKLPAVNWRSIRLVRIQFLSLSCRHLKLLECILEDCYFKSVDLARLSCKATHVEARFDQSTVDSMEILEGSRVALDANELTIRKLSLVDASAVIGGSMFVNGGQIEGSVIELGQDSHTGQFANTKLLNSTVISLCFPQHEPVNHSSVVFGRCLLLGLSASLCIDEKALLNSDKVICAGRIRDCRGVLFIDGSDLRLSQAVQERVWLDELCLVNFSYLLSTPDTMATFSSEVGDLLGTSVKDALERVLATVRAKWEQKRVLPQASRATGGTASQ